MTCPPQGWMRNASNALERHITQVSRSDESGREKKNQKNVKYIQRAKRNLSGRVLVEFMFIALHLLRAYCFLTDKEARSS